MKQLRLLALIFLAATARAEGAHPIVGAIRRDAWYGGTGPVEHVEHSLGQPKYHFRLPWFASIGAGGTVSINGDSQATMQAELNYAAAGNRALQEPALRQGAG